jgi:hypothetical protein
LAGPDLAYTIISEHWDIDKDDDDDHLVGEGALTSISIGEFLMGFMDDMMMLLPWLEKMYDFAMG